MRTEKIENKLEQKKDLLVWLHLWNRIATDRSWDVPCSTHGKEHVNKAWCDMLWHEDLCEIHSRRAKGLQWKTQLNTRSTVIAVTQVLHLQAAGGCRSAVAAIITITLYDCCRHCCNGCKLVIMQSRKTAAALKRNSPRRSMHELRFLVLQRSEKWKSWLLLY